jgi:hypothetical protein
VFVHAARERGTDDELLPSLRQRYHGDRSENRSLWSAPVRPVISTDRCAVIQNSRDARGDASMRASCMHAECPSTCRCRVRASSLPACSPTLVRLARVNPLQWSQPTNRCVRCEHMQDRRPCMQPHPVNDDRLSWLRIMGNGKLEGSGALCRARP